MRLIDATRIEQFILNNCSDNEEINTIYGELINAPSIDLVKCGECRRFVDDGWGFGHCERPFVGHLSAAEYGFCSEGERRADE